MAVWQGFLQRQLLFRFDVELYAKYVLIFNMFRVSFISITSLILTRGVQLFYLLQIIVGSFSKEGQRQLKPGNTDAFGTPATLTSAARSPPSLGTLSESSGGTVSPHNQIVEASNNSPGVAKLPWR